MPLTKKRLAREMLRAAADFHALHPWDRFDNDDVVPLSVPGLDHPAMASIMGAAGQEFGLSLFLGENAPGSILRDLSEGVPSDDAHEGVHVAGFTMSALFEIPPRERVLLELGGFRGRRESQAPWLISKRPGQRPRPPGRDELEILLFATRGLIGAIERRLVEPRPLLEGEECPMLVLSGDPRAPETRLDSVMIRVPEEGRGVETVEVPPDVASLPRREATWHVGFPVLPVGIEGDDRSVRAVVVLEPDLDLLLGAGIVQDAAEAPGEFFRIARTPAPGAPEPHLPGSILFRSRLLLRLLGAGLASLGIEVGFDKDLPALAEASEDFAMHLAARGSSAPEPGDLDGWKAADQRLTQRVHEILGAEVIHDRRNLDAFFGAGRASSKLLDRRFDEGAGPAYLEWLLSRHRSGPLAPRTGEEVLAGRRLSPTDKLLLRARLEGRISIYRFDEAGPDGRIRLVDVLDGSRHEIRDFSLSTNEKAIDSCVPMQIFRAGDYRFASLLGPAMKSDDADDALDRLESLVGTLTPEALSRKAEALGRLWIWRERALAKGPPEIRLTNAEKHVISFRETTFPFEGESDSLRKILLDSGEFEMDGDDLVWVRFMEEGAPVEPGMVVRGNVHVGGARVECETNSRERMAELKAILEGLPGVGRGSERDVTPEDFRGYVDAGSPGGPSQDLLIDSFSCGSGSPEAATRGFLRQTRAFYLAWPDMEIPALGGRTPRETCRTERGRGRIRRRILSMPRPIGLRKAGLDVPREEMLRELGLLDE